MFTQQQIQTHLERCEIRQRVNGQPNGYRPVTEAALKSKSVTVRKVLDNLWRWNTHSLSSPVHHFIILAFITLFAVTSASAHPNHSCHFHSDGTQHCK